MASITNKTSSIVRTLGLFSAIAILVLSGCAARGGHVKPPQIGYDQKFLTETLDHLMHDLKIARACPGKNIRSELQVFCKELFEDQSREHEQMSTWLRQWYKKAPPDDPWTPWLETQDGEVFERQFLKDVLKGHRDVANKATECSTRAEHVELARFCQEVAAHREQEAQKMERWSCEWFRDCE